MQVNEALTPDEQKQFDTLNQQRTAYSNALVAMQKQLQADPKRVELQGPIKQMTDNLAKVGTQIGPLEQKRDGVAPTATAAAPVQPGTAAKPAETPPNVAAPKAAAPNATAQANFDKIKKIQGILQTKNLPLGPTGADGKIGPFTLDGILSLLGGQSAASATTPTPGADSVLGTDGVKTGQNPNIDAATRATGTDGAPVAAPNFNKPTMSTESVLGSDPTLARIIDLARR